MNEYRFQTIQEYHRYAASGRRFAARWLLFAGLSLSPLLIPLGQEAFHKMRRKVDGKPVAVPGGFAYALATEYGGVVVTPHGPPIDQKGTGRSAAEIDKAVDEAISAWAAALHASIKRPRVSPGWCEDYVAAACSQQSSWQIFVGHSLAAIDLKTVMMHEVGHLLGVPHIEGDPLMNSEYKGKVGSPSRDAVAIARARMKWWSQQ